jgi:predicted RNA-binding Zn-ribbon protein involved in translation (DUF1610 family)
MGTKETTAGVPDRAAFEQTEASVRLRCDQCGREIVRLALREDRLVISSPLRRLRLDAAALGCDPLALLTASKPALHRAMVRAHQDGLDFYCPDCDALYCEAHFRCIPKWDEGY